MKNKPQIIVNFDSNIKLNERIITIFDNQGIKENLIINGCKYTSLSKIVRNFDYIDSYDLTTIYYEITDSIKAVEYLTIRLSNIEYNEFKLNYKRLVKIRQLLKNKTIK